MAKMQAARKANGANIAARLSAGRTPEVEARRIAATTKTWQAVELRQAQSERQRQIQSRPEVKAKRSASLKASWDSLTPEQRSARGKKLSVALKGHKKRIDRSDKARAQRSERSMALWATPEYRAKMTAANTDPEVVKRRGDAIRAGHARNKCLEKK